MTVDEALNQAIRTPVTEQVATLISAIGSTLTAFIAGGRSRQMPAHWAIGITVPRREAQRRLGTAYACWIAIQSGEGPDTARNWFIGANPSLGDHSPSHVLRESGDGTSVLAAARLFLENDGHGS